MKKYLIPLLVLFMSCKDSQNSDQDNSLEKNEKNTTAGATTEKPVVVKTYLRDTATFSGDCIIFLRPDKSRYKSYAAVQKEIINQVDSGFGMSIASTQSNMKLMKKYNPIKSFETIKRYIRLNDCAGCPSIIDRDTVDYGYILTGKNKIIQSEFNQVHAGNYLQEIDAFFGLKK